MGKIIKNMICNGVNRPHRSNTGENYYDYHDSDNIDKYILVKLIYFVVKLIQVETNFVFL
jgi:hypothetical protein